MPRPNKIWFRKDIGWWCVTVAGQKVRLAEGREKKKVAERKFHELKAIEPQAPESPAARVADIIEAFLAWAERHRSPETLRNFHWYGQMFAERWGYLQVSELKPIHVTRWIDEKKWGQTTQCNARRSIARAFSWAVQEGILQANPLHGMKYPRGRTRSRVITDDEFRTLLRNSDMDFRILLYALRATGCRPKEARTLKWSQVHTDRWILVEHKTAATTQKPRVIYLTAAMQKLMNVLRRRFASEYVFLNGRGQPWTSNAIRLRITRVKKKAQLASDVCAYLLRHAFGTNAILNGVDPLTVAELMGHSSLEMIRTVYVHLADQHSHLHSAVEKAAKCPVDAKHQTCASRSSVETLKRAS